MDVSDRYNLLDQWTTGSNNYSRASKNGANIIEQKRKGFCKMSIEASSLVDSILL
jgi:hypothetical protein